MSKIEWTDKTWNPVVGCSKISAGCQNCYAIEQAHRNAAIASTHPNPGRLAYYEGLTEKRAGRTEWAGVVNFVPEALTVPLGWRKPRRVFVNSMSDLFHESVSFDQIDQIFAVMALTPHHTYQVLTKRPDLMLEYMKSRLEKVLPFRAAIARAAHESITDVQDARRSRLAQSNDLSIVLSNVWLGGTVENQRAANERIPLLLRTPAALRFLSCEPLLDEVDLSGYGGRSKLGWVIVGGESGHGARVCNIDNIAKIVSDCRTLGIPVFVKQMGADPISKIEQKCLPISDRKGAIVADWPEYLRVQQFPGET